MKNMFLSFLVIAVIGIPIQRIRLQIKEFKIIKKNPAFRRKIGIDNFLILIPEFIPIKTYKNLVEEENSEEIKKHWKSIKIYCLVVVACFLM